MIAFLPQIPHDSVTEGTVFEEKFEEVVEFLIP